MEIIATLPPPYMPELLGMVAKHHLVNGARFNVGARVPYPPKETLERILEYMDGKRFWVDLKGRQLRVVQWAVPTYGDIILNHEIKVDLPAEICFRREEKTYIKEIRGNTIFVDPRPPRAIGAGQSVNVHGDNLKIFGYLTDNDKEYIAAATELGINDFMASFVEEESDIREILEINSQAAIVAKIESPKGLEFAKKKFFGLKNDVTLMAARDDLFTNIGADKTRIIPALKELIKNDPSAIVASRLFESLIGSDTVSMPDLSDLVLMLGFGYKRFLLSDELCFDRNAFLTAMEVIEKIRTIE
jgi:hypothetical protein